MENVIKQIPFVLNNKNGILEVCYKKNTDIYESGFDLLTGLGFDINMCLGYPTIHGYFKEFEGTGYNRVCAWIQVITQKYFSSPEHSIPCKVSSTVDISDEMRKFKQPFFAYGYPAELYDAPCNNLGDYSKLEWVAESFLVSYPCASNNDTISYLLGFKWGYKEWDNDGERKVEILPLEILDIFSWNKHLEMLKNDFDNWNFK